MHTSKYSFLKEKKTSPILAIKDLHVHFPIEKSFFGFKKNHKTFAAVNGVTVTIGAGETLGIVGESGCGKSTLARALVGLTPITRGSVCLKGEDLSTLSQKEWRGKRKQLQMIFQDPLASLNPRMTIGDSISEPLTNFSPGLSKQQRRERVCHMMEKVGLLPSLMNRYPHEFSGGQCQRVGIARALIMKPEILICDEPVSALDVSIQAQVINLLQELQKEMGLTLIFIAHDLAVVKHVSDRILVMYLGKTVELGKCDCVYKSPLHPYTQALLDSSPSLIKKEVNILTGELPSPLNPPSGCAFRTRCPIAAKVCATNLPTLQGNSDHLVSCLLVKA